MTQRARSNQATSQPTVCRQCLVKKAALIRLRSSGYGLLHSLTCEFQFGQLYLDGNVPSFYMKQLAQETVREIDGVEEIVNRVIVLR